MPSTNNKKNKQPDLGGTLSRHVQQRISVLVLDF